MVVAVVFLGSLVGLVACIGAMLAGQPLWVALACYPLGGMTVALVLGSLAAVRSGPNESDRDQGTETDTSPGYSVAR